MRIWNLRPRKWWQLRLLILVVVVIVVVLVAEPALCGAVNDDNEDDYDDDGDCESESVSTSKPSFRGKYDLPQIPKQIHFFFRAARALSTAFATCTLPASR